MEYNIIVTETQFSAAQNAALDLDLQYNKGGKIPTGYNIHATL